MGILLTIAVVIGLIIALALVLALFVKKDYSVERDIIINRNKQEVFDYLKLIRNQEKYSVWVMKDPNVKIVYTGTDGTVGFTSSWTSDDKNVGVGEQEIKSINEGESMEVEVRFKKPFEATNYALTTVNTTTGGQTTVTSSFFGQCKFPMNVMFVFMSKILGKDMQKNLENMKANIEK